MYLKLKGRLQNFYIEGTGGIVLKPQNQFGSVVEFTDSSWTQTINKTFIFSCFRKEGLLRSVTCVSGWDTIPKIRLKVT